MSDEQKTERRYDVVLHVRVPGIYADDLLSLSEEFDDCAIVDILSESLRHEVGIVILSDDGDLAAHDGVIVGADVVERDDVWSERRLPEAPDV